MDGADRACDLECVKKAPPRHEFIGPVKIILVDPLPEDYTRKAWGSGCLALALIIMGAVVFTVFLYTLDFRLKFPENVHIFLCTMGYQLFLPAGIMMINTLFGGAAHLREGERKCQHFLLAFCAIGCGVTGSVIVLLLGKKKIVFSPHAIAGMVAAAFLVLGFLFGPFVYFTYPHSTFGKCFRICHMLFALPGFLAGMVCFILGIIKPSFVRWLPIKHLQWILIFLSCCYSLAVLLSIYLKAKLAHD